MKWFDFSRKITGKNLIDLIEEKTGLKFPSKYKFITKRFDSGQPTSNVFEAEEQAYIFKNLLSVDSACDSNILTEYEKIKKDHVKGENTNIIPFAKDSSGNYFCFCYETNQNPRIVHKNDQTGTETVVIISDTFDNFISNLT